MHTWSWAQLSAVHHIHNKLQHFCAPTVSSGLTHTLECVITAASPFGKWEKFKLEHELKQICYTNTALKSVRVNGKMNRSGNLRDKVSVLYNNYWYVTLLQGFLWKSISGYIALNNQRKSFLSNANSYQCTMTQMSIPQTHTHISAHKHTLTCTHRSAMWLPVCREMDQLQLSLLLTPPWHVPGPSNKVSSWQLCPMMRLKCNMWVCYWLFHYFHRLTKQSQVRDNLW